MITGWSHDVVVARARGAVARGLLSGVGKIEARAVNLIVSGEKSGRIYRRRGVEHQASAPGEPPASDTGRLVASREVKLDAGTLRAVLAFHTAYAAYLEHGTIKMEPRPFARRALMEGAPEARADVARELATEFSR